MNGFLLIDKPSGITSFAVVRQVRDILKVKKVGHCGTLDPLATGLLIICLDRATKLAQLVIDQSKSYLAEVMLGWRSDTYDRDGKLTEVKTTDSISEREVRAALDRFRGVIRQRPPIYSAIKHQGKPLYKYARDNIVVETEEREVTIEALELVDYAPPAITLEVSCSKGTYIRSLAHDLGELLGCGAYVNSLRRTHIGRFTCEEAITLETLAKLMALGQVDDALMTMDDVLTLPSVFLTTERAARVKSGIDIRSADILRTDVSFPESQVVAIRSDTGQLLALGRSLYAAERFAEMGTQRVVEYIRVI
ncbi:MAG: tRNA pseudouridine(55) synthase TruB [candidate division Zixibacteria bacterium]|nr:tRNA pseudouridine(55) synthase TruB [candidate division Zixibacteria bacterium]